jgi:hypothetical protein
MAFPLNLVEMSQLLAIIAVILLATSELISPNYSRIHIQIDKKKLKRISLMVAILFLISLVINMLDFIQKYLNTA